MLNNIVKYVSVHLKLNRIKSFEKYSNLRENAISLSF